MKKFFCLVLSGFIFCACSFFDSADERNDLNSASFLQASSCIRQIKIVPSIGVENFMNASTRSAVAKIPEADKQVEYFKNYFNYRASIVDTGDGSVLASSSSAISFVEGGSFSLVFSYPDFNSAAGRNIRIKIYGFRSDLGAGEIETQMAKAEPESSLYAEVNAVISANTMLLALSQPVVFIPGKDGAAAENLNGIKLAVKLPEGASSFTYSMNGQAESSEGVSPSSGYAIISRTHTEANPLPCGIHDVSFYVKDSNGRILYFWNEKIYVYYRLFTNVWNSGSALNENIDGEIYSVRDVSAMVNRTFYVYGEGSTFFNLYGIQKPADESEDSGSIIKPFLSVQSAIDKILEINDGTSDYNVYIDGTFTASDENTPDGTFTASDENTPVVRITSLGKDLNLTIRGIGTTESTKAVLSGGTAGSDANPCVVQLGTPSTSVDKKLVLKLVNLNITNGGGYKMDTKSYGGGICSCLNKDSELTLDSVTVSGNKAAYGGGIYTKANLDLKSCTISLNNATESGGGIYQDASDGMTICDVNTVIGNADATEAATAEEGKHSNKAGNSGGGVYLEFGIFKNFGKIIYNYAEGGTDEFGSCGGIYNSMGTIRLSGGAILHNSTSKNKCGIVSAGAGGIVPANEIENDAVVDEVHLLSGTVKIIGDLSGTSPVATISLPDDKYAVGTKVLTEGTPGLIAANHKKFKMANKCYIIDDKGCLCDFIVSTDNIEFINMADYAGEPVKFIMSADVTNDQLVELAKKINSSTAKVTLDLSKIPLESFNGYVAGKNVVKVILPDNFSKWSAYIIGSGNVEEHQLEAIEISPDNPNYTTKDGVLYDKDVNKLLFYPYAKPGEVFTVPDTITEIRDEAFRKNSFLKKVIMPKVIKIGMSAFEYNFSLETVELGEGITSLPDYLFIDCKKLKNVTVPSTVKSLGGDIFYNCSSLEYVKFMGSTPPSLTRKNDRPCFKGCPATMKFYVPSGAMDSYKNNTQWSDVTFNQYGDKDKLDVMMIEF